MPAGDPLAATTVSIPSDPSITSVSHSSARGIYNMRSMSLARIEEEILRQQSILSDLNAQKNRFALISRLPDEILATIFIYCVLDWHTEAYALFQPHWVKVSYVCRHWRDVALNCPTLWTYISVMTRRWTEEFLARSKRAPLKIRIRGRRCEISENRLERVMNHIERIQELTLHLPVVPGGEILSKLSPRAPRLQDLRVWFENPSPKIFPVLFGGDTPALRSLELCHCPTPWYSLKLSGLTKLSLHYIPVQFQQNTEEFLATLSCMQDLTQLDLVCSLAGSPTFISTAAFSSFEKINLPRLSRLWIKAQPSTAIALFSCVKIPLNTGVRLECLSFEDSSPGHYSTLLSLLAQRFNNHSGPTIRSLIIESSTWRPKLTFSALERDFNTRVPVGLDSNTLLLVQLAGPNIEDCVIDDILSTIPMPHVQSLHVVGPPISSTFWEHTLGHLENLRYLKLSDGDMPELASVLDISDDMEDQDRHADGSRDQTFAPLLQELELFRIAFESKSEYMTPTRGEEALDEALSTRKGHKVLLTKTYCTVVHGYSRSGSETEDDRIYWPWMY